MRASARVLLVEGVFETKKEGQHLKRLPRGPGEAERGRGPHKASLLGRKEESNGPVSPVVLVSTHISTCRSVRLPPVKTLHRTRMRIGLLAGCAVSVLLVFVAQNSALRASQVQGNGPATPAAAPRALVDRYCVTCHNPRNKANAGGLDLTAVEFAKPAQHAEIFEKVITKLRAGLMPPPGRRRPAPADRADLIAYLETELDEAADAAPNPGRTEALHRLNRAEYGNAVRDLLGLELDVTSLLPSDDASFGFDNIAGVLKISESRLEQYLNVARRISRAAVGTPLPTPLSHEYRIAETTNQYDRIQGLPFGTRGGIQVRHHFPQEGEYEIQVDLLCRLDGVCDGSVGFADEHQLLVLVDAADVQSFTLEPRKHTEFRPPAERTWRVRLPLTAGAHDVAATFRKLPSIREVDSPRERYIRPYYLTGGNGWLVNHTIYQPYVDLIRIVGPFNATGPGQPMTRQRVFSCYPEAKADEEPCAKAILGTLSRRAYRGPVTSQDVEPLLTVYREARKESGFEGGIEAALQALLVSPEFLYRVEYDPAGAAPDTNYHIPDLALASRLSFFLWSSIFDEPLLTAAGRGQLKDPVVLEQQVRRMLADPRADRLVENFTGQWLWLRNLPAHRPDRSLFPEFDDTLRAAARRETELLFAAVLREERPVLELLTADYTFVNERLARHYGIPGIYGTEFRRVTIPDPQRRGILGHASVLTVTSRPNRTSPVIRGKWILENILGTPAPEPPPDVPTLKEEEVGAIANLGTMRERMAAHRVNPVCAGCHAMLEPPGLALENFDATGKWRELDESMTPVDASGAMPDGSKFEDFNGFRTAMLKDPDTFATTVTKKLMTYALGRGLEAHDMPAVRRIVREAKSTGLRLSDLVFGIVRSIPFQMRRTEKAES